MIRPNAISHVAAMQNMKFRHLTMRYHIRNSMRSRLVSNVIFPISCNAIAVKVSRTCPQPTCVGLANFSPKSFLQRNSVTHGNSLTNNNGE